MLTGLDKLVEAAASVDILKAELELKDQEIKVATEKAEEVTFVFLITSMLFTKCLMSDRLFSYRSWRL